MPTTDKYECERDELLALAKKIAALRDHEPSRATVAILVMEARAAVRNAEARS